MYKLIDSPFSWLALTNAIGGAKVDRGRFVLAAFFGRPSVPAHIALNHEIVATKGSISRIKLDKTRRRPAVKVPATKLIAMRNYDPPQGREYPVRPSAWVAHRTALRAEKVWRLKSNEVVRGAAKALSSAPLTYSQRHDDSGYVVFCFAKAQNTSAFCERFSGERFARDAGSMRVSIVYLL